MGHRVGDIARALGAEAAGDLDLIIDRAAEPAAAGPQDLALAMDARYAGGLAQGQARAAVLWSGADWAGGAGCAPIGPGRPQPSPRQAFAPCASVEC